MASQPVGAEYIPLGGSDQSYHVSGRIDADDAVNMAWAMVAMFALFVAIVAAKSLATKVLRAVQTALQKTGPSIAHIDSQPPTSGKDE